MSPSLTVGTSVPDISFRVGRDEVRLESFKGEKNVVVAFYAAAFTGG